MTELDRLMSLHYTISIKADGEGDFIASVVELPGCITHAESEQEALSFIRLAQRAWFESAIENGTAIPAPAPDEDELPSGKWLQRVPRSLHGRLNKEAVREGTSLNQLVTGMLSEAISVRDALREVPSKRTDYSGLWAKHKTKNPEKAMKWIEGSEQYHRRSDFAAYVGKAQWETDPELHHRVVSK